MSSHRSSSRATLQTPGWKSVRPSDQSHRRAHTSAAILDLLRNAGSNGIRKSELARQSGVSLPTVQRCLDWLRHQHDAPINAIKGRWVLSDLGFTLPLIRPENEDLVALMLARALLQAWSGTPSLPTRLDRMIESLDDLTPPTIGETRLSRNAVTTSLSFGTIIDPKLLLLFLNTCGRGVVTIQYRGIWSGETKTLTIEPWAIRFHDGTAYLRAYSRLHREARTFRLAEITKAQHLHEQNPQQQPPGYRNIWGPHDPAYGVDVDRPDVASLRFHGPVARWVAPIRWHHDQNDRWDIDGEVLFRRVHYRSCRAFARRLLHVIDGLEILGPRELSDQVHAYLSSSTWHTTRQATP